MAISLLTLILVLLAASLLLVITALYVIPITVSGAIGYDRFPWGQLTTGWGVFSILITPGERFTLVFRVFGHDIFSRVIEPGVEEERVEKKKKEKKEKVEAEKPPVNWRERISRVQEAWPYLKKPISTALRSLRVRSLSSDFNLGFGDPATTGMIYGYHWVIKGILSPLEQVCMSMTPSFHRRVLKGEAALSIAVEHPLMIMLSSLWAFTKKPVRDLMREEAGQ